MEKENVHQIVRQAYGQTALQADNPEAFCVTRYLAIAHHLTDWHSVRHRAGQLGLRG